MVSARLLAKTLSTSEYELWCTLVGLSIVGVKLNIWKDKIKFWAYLQSWKHDFLPCILLLELLARCCLFVKLWQDKKQEVSNYTWHANFTCIYINWSSAFSLLLRKVQSEIICAFLCFVVCFVVISERLAKTL